MKKLKNIPSLTKYVVFSISLLIIYSAAEFICAIKTNNTHDTLTTCIFACFGGEILSCALIKIFKLKEVKRDDEQYFNDSPCDCIGFDVPDSGSTEEDCEY